jgi:hypothetical protein
MGSAPTQDFGWRPGFAQLGCYRRPGGLGFVYAPLGEYEAPIAGTVQAWIATNGPWTNVVMVDAYEPAVVRNFPVRTAVNGGQACAFPAVEADALVAAGLASPA